MTLEPDDIRFHLTSSQQFDVRASMLLLHHNQLLVYRDCDYQKTTFIVPGGAIKFNETGQEAAVRETLEEVGIRIANPEFAGFIEAFWTNDHKSFHQITMVFRHEVIGLFSMLFLNGDLKAHVAWIRQLNRKLAGVLPHRRVMVVHRLNLVAILLIFCHVSSMAVFRQNVLFYVSFVLLTLVAVISFIHRKVKVSRVN